MIKFRLDMGLSAIRMQEVNFRNFVGEDIELANRSLGQRHNHRKAVRRFHLLHLPYCQLDALNRKYRLLGVMMMQQTSLHQEVSEYRSLRGFTDNYKRLDYGKQPEPLSEVLFPCAHMTAMDSG